MTLIFSGHGFRYETEAVAKLFFPAQPFSFTEDGSKEIFMNTPGPCCLILRDIGGGGRIFTPRRRSGKTPRRDRDLFQARIPILNIPASWGFAGLCLNA